MLFSLLFSCVYTYPNLRLPPPKEAITYAPLYKNTTSTPSFQEPNLEGVFAFTLPEPAQLSEPMTLWATYYFTPIYPYSRTERHKILDLKGKAFGPKLSAKDWCQAALQGSFSISYPDGTLQTFNYAGLSKKMQVNCKPFHRYTKSGRIRFQLARGPYGDGATGIYSLIPLRSVAVDPNVIPYGSLIYIPKARGLEIQIDEYTTIEHDGYFFANDTGGAIRENHIDVFSGNLQHKELYTFVSSKPSETFEAYIIDDGTIQPLMKEAHKTIVERGHALQSQPSPLR